MKIEDKRSTTSSVPAVEILNEVLPHFQKRNFAGIRSVVLLDQNYHKGPAALGRYCAIKGTKQADVEIYFEWIDDLPEEVRSSKLYLTYQIVHILMHEVYHHIVRGQHRLRQPKFAKEQTDADRWATGAVAHVFKKVFPREQHEQEWLRLKALAEEAQRESNKKNAAYG
jgi:hypothetical protein